MSRYDDVLVPFKRLMETELHANAAKGDRPGWLSMTAEQCLLEIYYHVSKLQKAVRDGSGDRIKENTADVANMAMMLADICGALDLAPKENEQDEHALRLETEDRYNKERSWRLDAERQVVELRQQSDAQAKVLVATSQEAGALRMQAEQLREQLAKEAVWSRFAGWLLDHCEGQEIYEERLQYWFSEMLAHEKDASTEGKDHE